MSNISKVKKPGWIKEFGDFINQGNVMDMAVGVIIGAAFGKIISSLVGDIIMPLIGLIVGGVDFTNLKWEIPNFFGSEDAAIINYGNFLQNIVDFLIVALCIFFMVRTLNKVKAKATARLKAAEDKKDEAEAKKEDEQTKLLREIRNALVKDKKK